MALALEERAMKDDIMLGDTPKARKRRRRLKAVQSRGRLWKHSTLADIDGVLAPGVLEQMFAFTMVRNPWDRMVSYYHWLRDQRFDHAAVRLAGALEFGDFVAHPATRAAQKSGTAARYMRRADGQEQCAAYIRVEHFEEDVAPVEAHLGFALRLERINTSERARDYRGYYSAQTAQIIAQDCGPDIERFAYRFE